MRAGFDFANCQGSLPRSDGVLNLSSAEAYEYLSHGAMLVDLRESYETNYRVFAVDEVLYLPWTRFASSYHVLPHDRPLILADAAGIYCREAAAMLCKAGYTNIAKLSGGMIDWDASGLPVRKDSDYELGGQCACKIKTRTGENPLMAKNTQPERKTKMTSVLFLCVHNSARSQMAEAFLKKHGAGCFEAESAGLEPGKLNPYVVRSMAEAGIDISGNATKSVFDLHATGKTYDVVVTVCSKEAAERCPIFPGLAERHHWPFEDPSSFKGTDEEIMTRVRSVRDEIEKAVISFIKEHPRVD